MSIRILLIDDDEDDQLIFREIIAEISPGIACIGAHNGLEGLSILTGIDPAPALIFLDLNMTFISGWDVLERLWKDGRARQIPVVVMSTSDSEADEKRALDLGARAFLTKTGDLALLRQVIRKMVTAEKPVL